MMMIHTKPFRNLKDVFPQWYQGGVATGSVLSGCIYFSVPLPGLCLRNSFVRCNGSASSHRCWLRFPLHLSNEHKVHLPLAAFLRTVARAWLCIHLPSCSLVGQTSFPHSFLAAFHHLDPAHFQPHLSLHLARLAGSSQVPHWLMRRVFFNFRRWFLLSWSVSVSTIQDLAHERTVPAVLSSLDITVSSGLKFSRMQAQCLLWRCLFCSAAPHRSHDCSACLSTTAGSSELHAASRGVVRRRPINNYAGAKAISKWGGCVRLKNCTTVTRFL